MDEPTLIDRITGWVFEDEEWSPATSDDYIEGFRAAQQVVLGLIQAWTEPSTQSTDLELESER